LSPSKHELKVTADHLKRDAYLYVRQSTLRQVAEHGESTQRRYVLRDRTIAAGWPIERVHVIDRDLGKSRIEYGGARRLPGARERARWRLASAGVVVGLEVSTLARNSADRHRLIELSALTATLIPDEDGIQDPAGFNDRLLLELKGGTMRKAELHILKARMRGGQVNKAAAASSRPPSVGLVYRTDGTIGLDRTTQNSTGHTLGLRELRAGRKCGQDCFFQEQGLMFPRRLRTGPNKGELLWALPQHARMIV
jgi:DNA invertase Pin-like site-specific DNA recombinase